MVASFGMDGDRGDTVLCSASGRWYTVGDRGRIDNGGYLYLTGRTAECIISGGVTHGTGTQSQRPYTGDRRRR